MCKIQKSGFLGFLCFLLYFKDIRYKTEAVKTPAVSTNTSYKEHALPGTKNWWNSSEIPYKTAIIIARIKKEEFDFPFVIEIRRKNANRKNAEK